MINLVLFVTTPGKWSCGSWAFFLPAAGSLAREGAVLEAAGGDRALLVLLTLCDGSGHQTLALVNITDAHPLPVDRLLPQGHLIVST